MMMLIAAAAVAAAQPASVPANAPAPNAQMMPMAGNHAAGQHDGMAGMKDCCCHDMMAKMQNEHAAGHEGHPAQ
jgi:hypothetical protein